MIGAWFIQSSNRDDWPKPLRKVMKKASFELTSTLEKKQYKLFIKAGDTMAVPD